MTSDSSLSAITTLIQNVNAITVDEEDNNVMITLPRLSTIPEAIQDSSDDTVFINNPNADGSFDSSSSIHNITENYIGSATDHNVLQDIDASVLQDADTAILQDTDLIELHGNSSDLQDADTADLQEADADANAPHMATTDIQVKDPQHGTIETLHDACTIDSFTQSDSPVASRTLNVDTDRDADESSSVSASDQETSITGSVTVKVDGDDYVVEVYV